ncbi:MAG TPA: DNA repair protein RecO [Clostridiales bacterium]|nr:DNA repair protein RecO [Clostridiales bacterium]
MKQVKTQGVVLRYSNRNEADRLLTVLSPDLGRILVFARGCRKPNSRFLSFSQLFCYGELVMQPYRDIYILTQADVKNTYFDLRNDMDRFACATYAANLTEEAATTGESNVPLFTLLLQGLSFLSYGESSPIITTLIYELMLLELMGYRPVIENCIFCGSPPSGQVSFVLDRGGIACRQCCGSLDNKIILHNETVDTMKAILDADDMKKAHEVPMTTQANSELNKLLPAYIEYKLEIKIKSRSFINLIP